jgi:hypothetical protein
MPGDLKPKHSKNFESISKKNESKNIRKKFISFLVYLVFLVGLTIGKLSVLINYKDDFLKCFKFQK